MTARLTFFFRWVFRIRLGKGFLAIGLAALGLGATPICTAASYYLNPIAGDDAQTGTSPTLAFRTLDRANRLHLNPGDRVLLLAGQKFAGQLGFEGLAGTAEAPIVLSSYQPAGTSGPLSATIDGRGYPAAIRLSNCSHIRIDRLTVTADGGGMVGGLSLPEKMRCGILIQIDGKGEYAGIEFSHLLVKDISYENPGFVRPEADVRTANGSGAYGWGIRFIVNSPAARLSAVTVRDCQIENVDHTGLKFTAPTGGIRQVTVERVTVRHAGGPGVQMSGVQGGHFTGLSVDHSGSTRDTRNWGRGSGLWTWGTSDVVIEKSRFVDANGPGDSAGVHIDFNCRNVIVQYNFSAHNAGGFCEILGNNHNCAYRYNVSVNDGHRVKGVNGAFQAGKTFWLSGYVGNHESQRGPFDSYFYNNTIYVSADIVANVAIAPTAQGVLIANNIFNLVGPSAAVRGDQARGEKTESTPLKQVVFENNLYLRADNWPAALPIHDRAPIFGNPEFAQAGGLNIEDYIPGNPDLISNRGIKIPRLPGDTVGLEGGLAVTADILGQPVANTPGLGAIECVPPVARGLRANELRFARIFSDHAVLQRNARVPVWGWANAGANVTVEFAGQMKSATADANGKWLVLLDPLAASAAPRPLSATTVGQPSVELTDVLVGEVWLGSGQSNMALPVR